ncbi:hypothetical protein [Priestia megaterium]|uniref:hypothetical protein n=1 Tax=Priestia megaterium TaxID=1404 RepID=UPI001129B3BA|nr:hypothetical protein [Priestia megaterium]
MPSGSSSNRSFIVHCGEVIQKCRMVLHAILKNTKKVIIPFGVVTSTFLFANMADAASFTDDGDVTKGYFSGKAMEERGGSFSDFKSVFAKIEQVANFLITGGDTIKNAPSTLPNASIEFLAWIYKTTSSVILYTPLMLFNNQYFKDTTGIFMTISAGLVVILTIFEGIKRMCKKDSTGLKEIGVRVPVATIIAGAAPWLFKKTFQMLNYVSSIFINLSHKQMTNIKENPLVMWDGLNTLALFGFDIVLLFMMFGVFMQNARRWFDIICLGALTPVALTAWIFKDHRHHFDTWYSNVKDLSFVHLYYAIFLFIIGMIMFGTPMYSLVTMPTAFLAKFLIIIGGLYRLKQPPKIFSSKVENGVGINTMLKTVVNGLIVTKFPVAKMAMSQVSKFKSKQEANKETLAELRQKHGRRFVGDLKNKK